MSTSTTPQGASRETAHRLASLFRRLGPAALAVAVASLLWVIPASLRVMATNSNNVADWLPGSFQATKNLTWFIGHFGSDEILVISWPGCTLEDERLPQLADALQNYRYPSAPDGSSPFRQILTGPQVIEQLTSEPARLTRDQAIERMTGWLIGPDGQTSCVVALLSEAGLANRQWPVGVVYETAKDVCGIPPDQLKLGGATFDSAAIDWASLHNVFTMAGASLLISVLIAWWALRSWLLTALVFADATYSLGLSLAIMDATGQPMNSMLIIVPALVYVLAISASIHLANYFREAARQTTPELVAARTLMLGWLPCLLASVTTAIGLGSLAVSQLVPIRQFAIYSATGTLIATAVLLFLFPAALQLFSGPLVRSVCLAHPTRSGRSGYGPKRLGSWLARWVITCHQPLVVVGIAALLLAGYGASRVRSSFDLQSLFRAQSYVVRNYAWLEQELGPLIPVEVVVRFDRESSLSWLDRLVLVRQIQDRIQSLDHVGGTISPATFMPDPPQGSGARVSAARSVFKRRLPEYQQQLRDVGYWAESADEQLWRITARVEALADIDFGDFLDQLRVVVRTQLDETNETDAGAITFTDCGGVPLVHSAQRQILRDLLKSFLMALVLITLAVTIILRNVLGGLLMMLPNIFPVLAVFGTMGWLGANVDIGGMMTASVALGIAVDDTLHFLTWFQRARCSGHGRRAAIVAAYRRCTAAMSQTTAVCALGMLAFAFSEFVPIARFAWLMAAALLAALLGDLVLLPALLASRLGRVFRTTGTD